MHKLTAISRGNKYCMIRSFDNEAPKGCVQYLPSELDFYLRLVNALLSKMTKMQNTFCCTTKDWLLVSYCNFPQ